MAFVLKLKEARQKAGMSQRQLAIKSGIAQSKVNHYDNGKAMPTCETLGKLADVLGVQWHELVERTT